MRLIKKTGAIEVINVLGFYYCTKCILFLLQTLNCPLNIQCCNLMCCYDLEH